ncbi:hypothetical protein [Frankia sp. ArI3]|uniref:hypothetical protein n=1 Tax=Frankia sp. ArI3 TaxID=1858 RepID=UPI001C6FCD4B|nr:hypothetical protein [Frankia sp. ArI3]
MLAAAANPVWRGGTIVGDAVLVGAARGGVETSADPAYTRVLLASAGSRFGVELCAPAGEPEVPVLPLEWTDVFVAYDDGLRLARGYPLYAVRVRPSPDPRASRRR